MKTHIMEKEKVWLEFSTLPLDAQYQVIEFMTFLHTQYTQNSGTTAFHKTKFIDEPFVGMWKNREDMRDSST